MIASRSLRRRVAAAVLLLAAICGGLGIHYAAPHGTLADIAGDVLYAGAAYLAVVIAAPRLRSTLAGAVALAWCVAIELFQLTGVPLGLGAVFPPAMLVLGTVFDGRDIAVYAVTIVVATVLDIAAGAVLGRRRAAPGEGPR